MTTWIDENLQKLADQERQRISRCQHAPRSFARLWSMIDHLVSEVNEKAIIGPLRQVFTQEENKYHYYVALPQPKGQPKELHIKLDKTDTDPEIKVSGAGSKTFKFEIVDTNERGGFLAIIEGAERLTFDEAARRILEPFLFPELSPKSEKREP